MKKQITNLFLTLLLSGLFTSVSYAQAPPQAISYQAVARDNNGNIIANKTVSLRFTIHDITAAGSSVYQETQNPTTNVLGLVNLSIGTGTVVSGTFAGINWGSGPKFLQVEIDPTGGSSYTSLGTSQMLSVPYALYAANGGGGGGLTGDSVIEVNGTILDSISSSDTTVYTLIPGLSRTINVPANSKVIVRSVGYISVVSQTAIGFISFFGITETTPAGHSQAQIALMLDGNPPASGSTGYADVFVSNTESIVHVYQNFSVNKVYDSNVIGVGAHTFSVRARSISIPGSTTSSYWVNAGANGLQSSMIIEIVKQ